jgi:carboxypeptidase Q
VTSAVYLFVFSLRIISNRAVMPNAIALPLLIAILVASAARAQQVETSELESVMSEALKPSSLEMNLRRLTDEIGGRVPGTPAMQQAMDWAVAAFKAAGADNIRTEDFKLPASWGEGVTEMSIIAPEQFSVRAISLAWAPALAPQHRVPIVDVGEGTAENFASAGNIAGALVLVHSGEMERWNDLFAEYLKAPPIIDLAVKGKALAIAFQSTRPHDLLYRHTNALAGEIDRLPMVLLAREDASRIARLLVSGQKLYADLSIPNRISGPISAANVVAEIRGSEKRDEFVLLGAHLDSWELGTGALDNGCNAALVVDALRAIQGSGVRPRRTIRFALFAGEEQGMIGSRAYVTAHRQELDRAAGVVIFDSGIGKVTGFSLGGRKDVADAARSLVAPLKPWDASTLTTDAEWGTDNFDFMLEGVPTFVANQEEANYLINYHASSDTFDKVDIQQLKRHVAEAAELTLALANTRQPVGPRLNRAQIGQTLRETHLEEQLKTFGIWQDWESGKRGRTR